MKKLVLFLLLFGMFGAMSSFKQVTDNSTKESKEAASIIFQRGFSFNPDENCTDWQLMSNGKYCRMCASGYGTYIPECKVCPYCLED
jgi:hypothetical protein